MGYCRFHHVLEFLDLYQWDWYLYQLTVETWDRNR